MSTITQTIPTVTPRPSLWTQLWSRLGAHFANNDAAHARQLQFTPAMDAIARDCALPVEVVLGITAYDPALPFFMQRGFDRAD